MSDKAFKTAEEALDIALKALERSEATASAAAEAINTVAEALQDLVEALYEDAGEGETPEVEKDTAPTTPQQPMPPLSGKTYDEYDVGVAALQREGEGDAYIPMMHVEPLDDTYPHEVSDKVCWCNPRIEVHNGGYMVIHNAQDGREQFESSVDRTLN